jgi:hypothetical protein
VQEHDGLKVELEDLKRTFVSATNQSAESVKALVEERADLIAECGLLRKQKQLMWECKTTAEKGQDTLRDQLAAADYDLAQMKETSRIAADSLIALREQVLGIIHGDEEVTA